MTKQAKTIMVMGTSSSAGKSLFVTALCRCFARRGYRVAPFKSQNMSNNAAVCADGSEIGRSQALQAMAAGVAPTSDMNPILLKPEGATHSQVIVNGRPLPELRGKSMEAVEYFRQRHNLWGHVTAAIDRLRQEYEVIVIEGAGSPAELNLARFEMVNMSVARYCQSPVILVGDIERGGVFAQLLGTLWLLPPEDRALVGGLVVNKFRGDLSLFDSGITILEERGEVPVLGVLPWLDGLCLPEEDAVALAYCNAPIVDEREPCLDVVVIHLPHIANFDDFDPIANHPKVKLRYVRDVEQLGSPDVLVIPGTKNTLGDLQWLRSSGLATRVQQLAQGGTHVVGICGGYQILGKRLNNPHHLEHNGHEALGLGLLDVETTFERQKQTCQVELRILNEDVVAGMVGCIVRGYEIHIGQTTTGSAWLQRTELSGVAHPMASQSDGASARHGQVWGCYLHGLFHNDAFREHWLRQLFLRKGIPFASHDQLANGQSEHRYHQVNSEDKPTVTSATERINQSIDRLANAVEEHLDFATIEQMLANPTQGYAHVR
jgi:adenosylcobyric acid synthase